MIDPIPENEYTLIDEASPDGTGWARFSADRRLRYRLGRILGTGPRTRTIVFLMLNPSTADAFKPDNTISRCMEFARRWEGDVLEVVNLFAFRSPYPKDLKTADDRGDGPENDAQILAACRHAHRVVAAWGTGGDLYSRAENVRAILRSAEIPLYHLGLSQDGHPKHPLARGKHYIPYTKELEVF